MGCATDAGLDGLVALLNHEHPKIRALAEGVIAKLEKQGNAAGVRRWCRVALLCCGCD